MTALSDIDFVIIGAQKSGTTSLHEVLKMHPEIQMPEGKENPVLQRSDLSITQKKEMLRALFTPSDEGVLKGKATPQYMSSRVALESLREINPSVKIIAILRDPVERTFSHFRMERRRAGIDLNFEHEVDRLLDIQNLRIARQTEPTSEAQGDYCVAWSEYGRQLEPYVADFGSANMLVLKTEDLKEFPEQVYKAIFEFLGIQKDWQSPEMGVIFHKGGDKPIINFKKLRRIPILGGVLKAAFNILPPKARYLINTRNIKANAQSARKEFPAVAVRLDRHFSHDTKLLRRIVETRTFSDNGENKDVE